MRTFLKITGTITVILLIVLLWALERVDYSPYFDSDYYKGTISQFDSISSRLSLAKGEVQVGFGKVSITPGLGAEEDDPDTGVFKEIPLILDIDDWEKGSMKNNYSRLSYIHRFISLAVAQGHVR